MAKGLSNNNLPKGGQVQPEQKNVKPIIILLSAAILIFLMIGQFFLPITTVRFDDKTKRITLNDFAAKDGMDFSGFTTDEMFFLTEKISIKKFLESSNITLEKYFGDNGISTDDLVSNVMNYKTELTENKKLFSEKDIINKVFATDIPLSEFMTANKMDKIILESEEITIDQAEKINTNQFLKDHNLDLAAFCDVSKTDPANFLTNVLNYKSDNGYDLLIDSYQDVIISIFDTSVPMSEYIRANNLSKEISAEDGGDIDPENDGEKTATTITILTAKLTPEQLDVLTDNYFESGFNSSDKLITFVFAVSVICCIATLVVIILTISKSKSSAEKTYKFISLSFIPMLVAKLLAFFADIIIKGEFTGIFGKYTDWSKFVILRYQKDDYVHIHAVPIYISAVLVISIVITLAVAFGTLIKKKLSKK